MGASGSSKRPVFDDNEDGECTVGYFSVAGLLNHVLVSVVDLMFKPCSLGDLQNHATEGDHITHQVQATFEKLTYCLDVQCLGSNSLFLFSQCYVVTGR